jgi:CubicO group peptidase (beta-lactamase class C family)
MFRTTLLGLVIFHSAATAHELNWAESLTDGFRRSARVEYSKSPSTTKQVVENKNALPIESKQNLDEVFGRIKPRSVLVSINDELVYEKHARWGGSHRTPLGMSMTKSLTSLAVGKAICAGHIKSIDDKVETYVPKLAGTSWGEAPIRQVLKMSSGAYRTSLYNNGHKTIEMSNKISSVLEGKLFENFVDIMHKEDVKSQKPGAQWNYSNFDTITLALVVEHSSKMSLAKFFEKEIWGPAGAESDGGWVLNSHNQVSAYNGFSAKPKDWLRLGQWILNELEKKDDCFGRYLNDAVSAWIPSEGPVRNYGYQIWVNCGRNIDFCFVGFAGQNLVFNRKHKLVAYQHAAFADPSASWLFLYEADLFIETELKNKK